ncbi:MAG: amino acid permease [Oscillospiraceae bacterium]|nr:amino acid permease [Oscillospiraceae bacterium]
MNKKELTRYLTPLGAWALAFGSSVGWGSFVMPGTTFLPIAGPLGSLIGLLIGALIMLLVGANYHYMICSDDSCGGTFSYTRRVFGYDHGFLSAWFLILTYIAIIWANATALPLIARNIFGSAFQVGAMYSIAGYQVYFGEVLLSICSLVICSLLCRKVKLAGFAQIVSALILIIGISVCFAAVFSHHGGGTVSMEPAFSPDHGVFTSIFNIVALAPWAYVGFENISHSTAEFRFSQRKTFRVLIVSLVTGAAAYIMLALLSIGIMPEGYGSWTAYFADLDNLSGLKALPTFFSTHAAMGSTGSLILGVTALCAIVTGLIGNIVASSRLVFSMAEDGLMPESFAKQNKNGAPSGAIWIILAISVIMPFFGRTAISWIVDVTTIGAIIAYAYTSACALSAARKVGNRLYQLLGGAGLMISLVLSMCFLIPSILSINAMPTESYLIFTAWSILGFAYFHRLLRKDTKRRFGRSVVVWIVLLLLIFFTSLIWVLQSAETVTERSAREMQAECAEFLTEAGAENTEAEIARAEGFIGNRFSVINTTLMENSVFQMVLVIIALSFLLRINMLIQQRERQIEREKALAEESSRAKTSFLSNMSHEIRTPMNAIIGLDNIALRDPDLTPHIRENLEKIGASARHLLGLINDILDMSRIESGRMVLKKEEFPFRVFMDQVNVMINGQCDDKGLRYECHIIGNVEDYYTGDDMKLKQVLINILGNSVKFTDPGGEVSLSVEQTASFEGYRTLRFTMKDTGIGMDKEYIPKIFEAFSQEDETTTNAYGGSGLGMAITKNFVDMMNGDIAVESEKGVGSTFTVTVTLGASDRSFVSEKPADLPADLRTLVVDDDDVACEHARLVLNTLGINAAVSHGGGEALGRLRAMYEMGQPYELLLTDYRMADMDGLELTRRLRSFDGGRTDVIILTGYNWDDIRKDAEAAGVAGIMSKPLFTDSLLHELRSIFSRKKNISPTHMDTPDEEESSIFASLDGRRILVAEDVDINAEILEDLLDLEGMTSERAENGQTAVDMFAASAEGYYDAILMDVRMPVLDGLAATRAIRELNRPDALTIPIIAMTANAFDEDVRRSLQAGMNAHLSKPVEADNLYRTLSRLIGSEQS